MLEVLELYQAFLSINPELCFNIAVNVDSLKKYEYSKCILHNFDVIWSEMATIDKCDLIILGDSLV